MIQSTSKIQLHDYKQTFVQIQVWSKTGQDFHLLKPQMHTHSSCYIVVSREKQWHVQPVTGHSLWLLWKQNVSGRGVKVESLDK